MLTTEQLQTLNVDIMADPTLSAYAAEGRDNAITAAYNTVGTAVVWRTSLRRDAAMGDGFDWAQVDNLTTGQARIWDYLFDNEQRSCNPSDANVRAGIAECWKGTAAKLAVQATVLGHAKQFATRAEALFATGAKTEVSPGTMVFEGAITDADVARALRG
jgi:hypothetical protein